MNFYMKYEHALFPKGEFNEELFEWVSYLVPFFKVLVSCSSTFEHPYHPLTLLWWEGGWPRIPAHASSLSDQRILFALNSL